MPTHLKVLRGNPGHRPLPAHEPQPTLFVAPPPPPAYLGGDAAQEWNRVAAELARMSLLAESDTSVLAAYCQAFARWRAAEAALAEMAKRDPLLGGLMVRTANKTPMQNPLVGTAARAASDMVRYAAEFGLSPSARARIAAGPFGEGRPSKFTGLLA
jgi:P27 family predicted phage terminase small subunit